MDIYPVGLASSSRGRDYIPLPLTDADAKNSLPESSAVEDR